MLIGVAVAFCAASTPHMMKPIVAIATKPITSWSNAPNDQQCGLYDNAVRNDFSAAQKAFEKICPVSGTLAIAWLGGGGGGGEGIRIGFAFDLT